MTQTNLWQQKLLGTALFTPKALIKHVGRTPAALLQQLHYSLQNSTFTQYGTRWVSRTQESWASILECSPKTIQRAFERLESMGLVLSSRFHRHVYCQRKSYRVDYDALQTLLGDETNRPDQPVQTDLIDVDTLSRSNNKKLNTDFKKTTNKATESKRPESIPTHHPVFEVNEEKIVVDLSQDCKGRDDSLEKSQNLVEKNAELDPELEQEVVKSVGHKLSAGLKMLVIQASHEVIQDALTILRTTKHVQNKAGLFRRAIENEWKPSAAMKNERKFTLDPDFNEWWDYAKRLGLVMGSELQGEEFLIYTAPVGEPKLYTEMRSLFSMSWLKKKLKLEAD